MRCTNSGHHRQGPAARAWAAAHARRLAPDEPEVHYVSGLVSFSNLDWTAARIHQERVLAPDPAHSGALNELGRIKLRRRSPARAARHFVHAAQSGTGRRPRAGSQAERG